MTNDKQKEKKLSPEEKAKKKAEIREIALKNLGSNNLINLAVAYLVHRSGQFGEAGDSAVEQYKYLPAFEGGAQSHDFESGEKHDLIRRSILDSREDGERYSGHVSEKEIIKSAAATIQRSLSYVKVQDVLDLIGSEMRVKGEYRDKYLSELAESENKEDKKVYEMVTGGYITYLTTKNVSEAFDERTKDTRKGLEKILCEPEKLEEEGR